MNGVELLTSWLTPTVLFCVLNVVIGTIFITSSLKPPHTTTTNHDHDHDHPPPPQLVRVPSFLERVKSFNISNYQSPQPDPAHEPPQLIRVPSFFERVKSFNRSPQPDPAHEQPQLIRVPSFLERVKSFNRSPQPDPAHEQPQLIRVPSFLERVKSFNRSSQPDPAQDAVPVHEEPTAPKEEEEPHIVTRSKSESAVAKAAKVLQKSASEKVSTEKENEVEDRRRPETTRERVVDYDEAVDEKADDFINRFRQQLKLQRLDSILRYKEMLNRGAGAGAGR